MGRKNHKPPRGASLPGIFFYRRYPGFIASLPVHGQEYAGSPLHSETRSDGSAPTGKVASACPSLPGNPRASRVLAATLLL